MVMSAVWGRRDSKTCSRGEDANSLNGRTPFSNVTGTLRQLCNNRSQCHVTADVTTLGDPRAGQSSPPVYLLVNYTCKSMPHSLSISSVFCQLYVSENGILIFFDLTLLIRSILSLLCRSVVFKYCELLEDVTDNANTD